MTLKEAMESPLAVACIKQCVVCGHEFQAPPSGKITCSTSCRKVLASKTLRRHGDSNTRLHNIWCGMKSRTRGTAGALARKYYVNVPLCQDWESYENFKQWALNNGYRDDLEIDRIDARKGYSPTNCRWSTRSQQMQNTLNLHRSSTSRYRGVSWCENVRKWRAQIQYKGEHFHLGVFTKEKDAALAYAKKAAELFGEFASSLVKEEFNALFVAKKR